MLEQTNVIGIQKGVEAIYKMSADERTRELIRMREKALHDEATALEDAMEAGIEKLIAGMRASGLTEEQIEAAKKAMQ